MKSTSSDLIQILTSSMNLISKTKDPKEISQIIEKMLKEFSASDHATLFIFDPEQQNLHDKSKDYICSMIEPLGILGEAFLTKEASYYNHLASEKNYIQSIDNPDRLRLRSQIVFPIVEDGELLGIIRTSRSIKYKLPYDKRDIELLNSLCSFIIKIIDILRSGRQANDSIDISKINKSIEASANEDKPLDTDSMMLLFSNTVHDIRTPANSLYGFLELIEEQIEDKRLKEFIEHAKESANFINILTDSILEQAKENHKIRSSAPTIINTVKFFAQTANIFSADMFTKSIDYIIYIDPNIPKEIRIDEIKLKRVLVNLIGNAYKFTPKNRRIDFRVNYNENDKKLKISVLDQGIGIELLQQKHIFNAFEQGGRENDREFSGSGLGLAISAKYVNDLGGELELQSEPDKGSEFYFTIPVDIVNSRPSYERFVDLNKKITILTDNNSCTDIDNIIDYLLALGIPREHIFISDIMAHDTTHLYCFQHKLTPEILGISKKRGIKLLIVEEELFSLAQDSSTSTHNIASKNTYYGDLVHSTAFSKRKRRILIADDNRINIMLLKSILDTEFVEVVSSTDGYDALDKLKKAHENGAPYDVIFMDEHMPSVSGSVIMGEYREYEKNSGDQQIFAISITGDPNLHDTKKTLYDMFIKKPFNTEAVRTAINSKRRQ